MPLTAPISTSVVPPVRELTRSPELVVDESVSGDRVGDTGVMTGASLTELTTRVAWAVPVENAVLPPLLVVSAVLRTPAAEAVPEVRSQARNVTAPDWPLKSAAGTNRSHEASLSSRAL